MEESSQDSCPVCLTDKYLNASMKLLVSPCFHKMCESCVNRIYFSGPAPCPICKQTLRKSNFVVQTFDDLLVEKEVNVRKRITKYYNKRPEDFGSLRAFNDYLESVEEIIFNLINNIDVEDTENKIEKYRIENRESINANLSKQVGEIKKLSQMVLRDKKERAARAEAYQKQIVEEVHSRKQEQGGRKKPKAKLLEKVEINLEMDEDFDEMEIDEYFEPLDLVPHYAEINWPGSSFPWPSGINPIQASAGGFSQEMVWQRALASLIYL